MNTLENVLREEILKHRAVGLPAPRRRLKIEPGATAKINMLGIGKPCSERLIVRVGPTNQSDLTAEPPMIAWNTPRLRPLVMAEAEPGDSAEIELPDGSRWIVTIEEIIPAAPAN